MDRIPADIHGQVLCRFFFSTLEVQAGAASVGLTPHSLGGTFTAEITPQISEPPQVGAGPSCYASPPLPRQPVLTWLFLYILSYKTSVRLVLRGLPGLIFLSFSCHFNLSWEEVGAVATHSTILTGTQNRLLLYCTNDVFQAGEERAVGDIVLFG